MSRTSTTFVRETLERHSPTLAAMAKRPPGRYLRRSEAKSDVRDAIARRMFDARDAQGLTHKQVAERVGLREKTYARQEERGAPQTEYLADLCRVYRITVYFLLTGRNEDPFAPKPADERGDDHDQRSSSKRPNHSRHSSLR